MLGLAGYEDSDDDDEETEQGKEPLQFEEKVLQKEHINNVIVLQKDIKSCDAAPVSKEVKASLDSQLKSSVNTNIEIEEKRRQQQKKKKKKAKLDISTLPPEIQEALSRTYHVGNNKSNEEDEDDDFYDIGIFQDRSTTNNKRNESENLDQDEEALEKIDKNTEKEKSNDISKMERLAKLREEAQLEKQRRLKESLKSKKINENMKKNGLFALLPDPSNSLADILEKGDQGQQNEEREHKQRNDLFPTKKQKIQIQEKVTENQEEEEEDEEEGEENQGLLSSSLYAVPVSRPVAVPIRQSNIEKVSYGNTGRTTREVHSTQNLSISSQGEKIINSQPSYSVPQSSEQGIPFINPQKGYNQISHESEISSNLPGTTSSMTTPMPVNYGPGIPKPSQIPTTSNSRKRKLRDLEREFFDGNFSSAASEFTEIQAPTLDFDLYANGAIQPVPDIEKPIVESLVYDSTSGQTLRTTEVGKKQKTKNQLNTLMLRAIENSKRQQVLRKNN